MDKEDRAESRSRLTQLQEFLSGTFHKPEDAGLFYRIAMDGVAALDSCDVMEKSLDLLSDARDTIAMLCPVGFDTGTVEQNVAEYIEHLKRTLYAAEKDCECTRTALEKEVQHRMIRDGVDPALVELSDGEIGYLLVREVDTMVQIVKESE